MYLIGVDAGLEVRLRFSGLLGELTFYLYTKLGVVLAM